MTYASTCSGSGPTHNNPILIIGEAPGTTEEAKGIPFIGPSGKLLRKALHTVGIPPTSVRFENVINRKVNPDTLYLDGKTRNLPSPEMIHWINDLKNRIASISPSLIITCGRTPLQVLTHHDGILSYHCTPHTYKPSQSHKEIPLLPLLHPAYILRNQALYPWLTFGLRKALRLKAGETYEHPKLILNPSVPTVLDTLQTLTKTAKEVAIDTEIFNNQLACISIAWSPPYTSICIPFSIPNGSAYSLEEEIEVTKALNAFLSTPILKIFQNYIFDTTYLTYLSFPITPPFEDTMLMANILHPELKKDLGTLGKLYTLAPHWKENFNWKLHPDPKDLWRYNALDAALTLQIAHAQRKALKNRKLNTLYEEKTKPLLEPVLKTCVRGIAVDRKALLKTKDETAAALSALSAKIEAETEEPGFNPRSPKQVKNLLSKLGLSVPRKAGKECSDRLSLLKVRRKNPHIAVLTSLLKFSALSKTASTYNSVALENGRCHFSINIAGTKSGRFSSSKTAWGTGLNIQNIPRSFRNIFIPDKGNVFIQLDLKQADARMVAWLSRDESLIKCFDLGGDIHKKVASLIFGKAESEISKEERMLGKKCVHAFNYGMAERTFIDNCLKESDLVLTMEKAKQLRRAYFNAFPRILTWHKEIQEDLRRSRRLVNPYGRELSFYGFLDDSLFRDAYPFIPSSTVADYINSGWINFEKIKPLNVYVVQQGHDSILVEAPKGISTKVISLLKKSYDSCVVIVNGMSHTIPYDIAIGYNWKDLKELT